MGSGFSSEYIKRDTRFDNLPVSAQPPRVLLVVTTQHDEWRIRSYVDALAQYSGAAIDIIAPTESFLNQFPKADNLARHDFSSLLKSYSGFVLSGGRPNVMPELYGEKPEFDDSMHDLPRDLLSIGLVQQAPLSMPVLGICLGMQQAAVAHGAKLKIVEHHGPISNDVYGPAHGIKIHTGTILHALQCTSSEVVGRNLLAEMVARAAQSVTSKTCVVINSVHWRAVDELSLHSINPAKPKIHVMAQAPDGTIEAIHMEGTNTIGVQNHPEKDVATNIHSRRLFAAFGLMLQGKLDLRDDTQFKSFASRLKTRLRIAHHAGMRHLAVGQN